MKRLAPLALGAALLVAGCAWLAWLRPVHASADPADDVARADDLARHNQPAAARDVYQRVLREHEKEAVAAEALWGLALLQVDAESPLCDYRAALATFDRLLVDHPSTRHAADARAWRAVLRQNQRLEAEAARLRTDLDRLKELDMEMERR